MNGLLFLSSVGNPEVGFCRVSAYINNTRGGANAELITLRIPSSIEVRLLLVYDTHLWSESISVNASALLPDDDGSIGGGTEEKICGRMPVQRANHIEVLLQNAGASPLRDVRVTTSLEDPNLIVRWADGYLRAVRIPGETLDAGKYSVCSLRIFLHI